MSKGLSSLAPAGLANRYTQDMEALEEAPMPYPLQYALSGAIRKKAAQQGNPDFLAMWSGQGVGLFKETTVESLMQELLTNSETLLGHRELAAVFRKSI